MSQKDPYDCKNSGDILQFTVNGINVSYCSCLDLKADDMNGYFTGPQCSYETHVHDVLPSTLSAPITPINNNMAKTIVLNHDYDAPQLITA